ncbi:MAG: hypothetical protein CBB71_00995, partial [Rhodopirellula sp. TMED11]
MMRTQFTIKNDSIASVNCWKFGLNSSAISIACQAVAVSRPQQTFRASANVQGLSKRSGPQQTFRASANVQGL